MTASFFSADRKTIKAEVRNGDLHLTFEKFLTYADSELYIYAITPGELECIRDACQSALDTIYANINTNEPQAEGT